MRIAATTTMAATLNKEFRRRGWDYKARQVWLKAQQYSWNVGDIYDAEDYGDYNDEKDAYRAIVVIYPDDYYACPRYITTRDLNRLFSKGDTLDTYAARVAEDCEI